MTEYNGDDKEYSGGIFGDNNPTESSHRRDHQKTLLELQLQHLHDNYKDFDNRNAEREPVSQEETGIKMKSKESRHSNSKQSKMESQKVVRNDVRVLTMAPENQSFVQDQLNELILSNVDDIGKPESIKDAPYASEVHQDELHHHYESNYMENELNPPSLPPKQKFSPNLGEYDVLTSKITMQKPPRKIKQGATTVENKDKVVKRSASNFGNGRDSHVYEAIDVENPFSPFQENQGSLNLTRASSDPPTIVEYSVTLFRGIEASFGLSYDAQNVVTGIVSGGAAQLSGQIRIGDKIHAINGNISSTGSETYSILVACATTANIVMKRTIDLMAFEDPKKPLSNDKRKASLIDILDREDPKYQIRDLDNIKDILKSKKAQSIIPDGLPAFLYSFVDKAKKVAFPAIVLSNTTNVEIISVDVPLIEALNASIDLGGKMIEVFQKLKTSKNTNHQKQPDWDLDAKLIGVSGTLMEIADDISTISTALNKINIASQPFKNHRHTYDRFYDQLEKHLKRSSYTKAHNFLQLLEEEDMYLDSDALMHGLIECKLEESVMQYQALLILRLKTEVMKQLKYFFKDISESATENMKYYSSKDGKDYLEFLEYMWSYMKTQGLNEVDCWKIPTVLVLGKTGTGKSSLCNVFAGKMAGSTKILGGFPVSAAQDSCTQETTAGDFCFFGNILRPVTLIDTPGFDDPKKHHDATIISSLVDKLKTMKEVHQILIAVNGTNPRLDGSMKAMIDIFQRMFTKDIWANIGIVFTKLSMDKGSIKKRNRNWEITDQEFADNYVNEIRKEFNIEDQKCLETYFIDACYDDESDEESKFFHDEMNSLWQAIHQKQKFDTNRVEKVMTEFDSLQEELKKKKQEMCEQKMTIKALEDREFLRLEQDREEARKPDYGYTWCVLKNDRHYETTIEDYVEFIRKVTLTSNHFSDQTNFDEAYWQLIMNNWMDDPNGFQKLDTMTEDRKTLDIASSLSFSLNINNTTKYFLRGESNSKGLGRIPDIPTFLWLSDFEENYRITRLADFKSFVVPPFTKERLTFFCTSSAGLFGSLKSVLTFTVGEDYLSEEYLEYIMLMFKVKGKGKNSYAAGFPKQEMDNSEAERIFNSKNANNEYYSKEFMSRRKARNKHIQCSQIFWPPEQSQQSGGFQVTFSIGNHKNCIGSFTLKKARENNVGFGSQPEMYRDLV